MRRAARAWVSGLAVAGVVFMVGLPAEAQRRAPDVRLESDRPGAAVEDEKLLVALPIENTGRDPAVDVRITAVTLRARTAAGDDERAGGQLLLAPALPIVVREILAGNRIIVQLAFARAGLAPGDACAIKLQGSVRVGAAVRHFQLREVFSFPPPVKARHQARTVEVPTFSVAGATLLPATDILDLSEMNVERGPPLPEGKRIGTLAPTNPSVEVQVPRPSGAGATPFGATEPVVFDRATTEPLDWDTDIHGGVPWDPSGASVDATVQPTGLQVPMVFLTGNRYALLSTDGGAHFTHLDPTTMFQTAECLFFIPTDCLSSDQNLIYIPSIDRFVWQMLTAGSDTGFKDANGNTLFGHNSLRVATASAKDVRDSGGTAWTFWDVSTDLLGGGPTAFFDYPDLSFSDNFLYISVTNTGDGGLQVIRVPLADVKSGPTIHIAYTSPQDGSKAIQARLLHDCPDAAYWFAPDDTSRLQIFEWPDVTDNYTVDLLDVDSWVEIDPLDWSSSASYAGNGINWLAANIGAIRGGTYLGGDFPAPGADPPVERRMVIAWNAARSDAFPQPYVRLNTLGKVIIGGEAVWGVESTGQIWNPSFAFQHAHLATNIHDEVGVSVAAGGPGTQVSPMAGFLGDPVLYAIGVSTDTIGRWGDYTAIRPHWPAARLFSVSDYYLVGTSTGYNVVHQYRRFGRASDVGP